MQVIEVIPLKKGVGIDSLSYYSSEAYEPGTILEVPVRNKNIFGVVAHARPVSTAKTALRTATFSLKKLPNQPDPSTLPKALIKTAKKLQKTTPAQLGSILFSLLPPDIRNGSRPYPQMPEHLPGEAPAPAVLTASGKDRYIAYRSYIREAFAHSGSVLFVVPTSTTVEEAESLLSKGIEKRVITFASTHTKSKLDKSYAKFEDLTHSKLIITTPNFAFLCRHDITTIIIEGSGSQHYVSRARPYLDNRSVLKTYAQTIGAEITLGDILPSAEDEILRREEKYSTFEEHANRLHLDSTVMIAEHPKENLSFSLMTDELTENIKRTVANRGRVFLYASRRGLAPIVICKDCGHIFRCPESGAPYSLLRTKDNTSEKRWFYCGTSGKRAPAADTCPDCGSWRLVERGIGIQQVIDHVKKHFPKNKSYLMDHTTANTHRKAKSIVSNFYKEDSTILVGSNFSLAYLSKPIDCVGIVSYEAMRSVPTWRADETVFKTLLTLREIASKDVVVQTRSEPDELLSLATKGLVDQFYDGEIEIRQSLAYPPFSTFILLTFLGNETQINKTETLASKALEKFNPTFYNGPLSNSKKIIRYGLIRIPAAEYPNSELLNSLTGLPPYIKIDVNPAKII